MGLERTEKNTGSGGRGGNKAERAWEGEERSNGRRKLNLPRRQISKRCSSGLIYWGSGGMLESGKYRWGSIYKIGKVQKII